MLVFYSEKEENYKVDIKAVRIIKRGFLNSAMGISF